ncbi:MAG TPA: LamG-like jellyroll fold domain-containing protein, partial [Tepidisphaeraceae bacterium]|nr:LamG-like jellyroll fold domain-containing protein [Tepidisphaeraceae bacterium]
KTSNWPPFVAQVSDEPGGSDNVPYAAHYSELLRTTIPGASVMADGGPWKGEDASLSSSVNIFAYCAPTDELLQRGRAFGLNIWTYNQGGWGRVHGELIDRDRWGLFQEKTGSEATYMWVYTWWLEPTVPPGWHPAFMYVIPAEDGPIPTTSWEAVREGINDARYVDKLKALIVQAKASGRSDAISAARQAEGFLESSLLPIAANWGDRNTYFGRITTTKYDLIRWGCAEHILNLQSILDQKGGIDISNIVEGRDVDQSAVQGFWPFKDREQLPDNAHFIAVAKNLKAAPVWGKSWDGDAIQLVPGTGTWQLKPAALSPRNFSVDFDLCLQDVPSATGYVAQLGNRWIVRIMSDSRVQFVANIGSGWKEMNGGWLERFRWQHVRCTYDGEYMRVYTDGELTGLFGVRGQIGGTGSEIVVGATGDGTEMPLLAKLRNFRVSSYTGPQDMPWK